MSQQVVNISRNNGVFEVELDRPKANAIDLTTSRLMGEAFKEFRDDPEMRVAIIKTAGDRFFCAGWDLKAAANGDEVDGDYGVGGFGGLQELRDLNKPVIAQVSGMACGGGFELALSADLIYCTDTSSFALPEINSGTVADAATVKLPKRIPYHVAMEMLFTGRWIDAAEAKRISLINDHVSAEKLNESVLSLAKKIATKPLSVVKIGKEAFYRQHEMSLSAAYEFTSEVMTENSLADDAKEGITSFLEKRDPIWKDD